MNNIFNDESTKQLAKLLFEVIKESSTSILESLAKNEQNLENVIKSTAYIYINNFEKKFGSIQILGMHEPMSLISLYVDVLLLDESESSKRHSIEALMKAIRENTDIPKTLQAYTGNKVDGITLAGKENKLIVLGPPGGGKTTYLRKIGMECLKEKNKHLKGYLPILIELKNIDNKKGILDLGIQELELANFPAPKRFLEESLKKGKIVFLLDGLDEIKKEFEDKAINDIRDFCDKYSNNKYIVSSRIASYKGGLSNFKNVEIASLNTAQIRTFIDNWFKEKLKSKNYKETADNCWETINIPEYRSTLELAQSPLLLTLLCLVYYYQQDFPKNRSLLYSDAINVLLKEWNAEKRIYNNAIYKEITIPFEELLFSNIAHKYFIQNQYYFQKSELKEFISCFVQENLNAPKYLDGSEILDSISTQQGILIERAKNIFSFSHLTFQEYFTARYIEDHGLVNEYVDKYLFHKGWREIFILLSGILKVGADSLINQIYVNTMKIIKAPRFKEILPMVNSGEEDIESDYKLFNILIILLFGSNYNCNSPAVQSILREINKNMYLEIRNSWLFDRKPTTELHNKLYEKLCEKYYSNRIPTVSLLKTLSDNISSNEEFYKVFHKNMGIEPIAFTIEEQANIDDYFDAISYLYQCKNSAITISRKKWENIEKGLFR